MKLLLDSNAYSHLKRGHPHVAELIRMSERVFLSAVVIGELFYGFRKGSRTEQNIQELHAFLDNPYVTFVPVSLVTADRYARITTSLRAKGRPIPSNDIWIAAHTPVGAVPESPLNSCGKKQGRFGCMGWKTSNKELMS